MRQHLRQKNQQQMNCEPGYAKPHHQVLERGLVAVGKHAVVEGADAQPNEAGLNGISVIGIMLCGCHSAGDSRALD